MTAAIPDWVHFEDGTITVKNPSDEQVRAVATLAAASGLAVRGDDGETYDGDGVATPATGERPGLFHAVLKPLTAFLAGRKLRHSMRDVVCPFAVGDRVRTTFRTGGIVTEFDPKAHHGLGSIKVRFADGSVLGGDFVGHDFSKEV